MSKKQEAPASNSTWTKGDVYEIVFPIGGLIAGALIASKPNLGFLSLGIAFGTTFASLEHFYSDVKADSPVVKVGGDFIDRAMQNLMSMGPIAQSDTSAALMFMAGIFGTAGNGIDRHFLGCMMLALGEALTGSIGELFE